jgi:hypothetical protein
MAQQRAKATNLVKAQSSPPKKEVNNIPSKLKILRRSFYTSHRSLECKLTLWEATLMLGETDKLSISLRVLKELIRSLRGITPHLRDSESLSPRSLFLATQQISWSLSHILCIVRHLTRSITMPMVIIKKLSSQLTQCLPPARLRKWWAPSWITMATAPISNCAVRMKNSTRILWMHKIKKRGTSCYWALHPMPITNLSTLWCSIPTTAFLSCSAALQTRTKWKLAWVITITISSPLTCSLYSLVSARQELQDCCKLHLSKALCLELTILSHLLLFTKAVVSLLSIRVSDAPRLLMLSTTNLWLWLTNSSMDLLSRWICTSLLWITDTEQPSLISLTPTILWWTMERRMQELQSLQWLSAWSNNNRTLRWHLLSTNHPATS